jgi:hypothetical protein
MTPEQITAAARSMRIRPASAPVGSAAWQRWAGCVQKAGASLRLSALFDDDGERRYLRLVSEANDVAGAE